MPLFIPITKVDCAKRLVYGRACDETPDRQGEIWDYAGSKPLWQEWSDDFAKKSDGKSLGNVRAMHGNVAAGKLIDVSYEDANKAIDVCAHIVDDAEWNKVEEGVYTGFSTGGKYVRKWTDPKNKAFKRVIIKPSELSLADLPANPSSVFDALKTDGTVEQRAFKVAAAEPVKVIPFDPKASAAKYARAIAKKGMYSVQSLASILESLAYMQESVEGERDREGDGSDLPERLAQAVETIAEIFVSMAQEESSELVEFVQAEPKGAKTMTVEEVRKIVADLEASKAGAKHSKETTANLEAAHKMATDAHKAVGDLKAHVGKMLGKKDDDEAAGKTVVVEAAKTVVAEAELPESVLALIADLGTRLEKAEKAASAPKAAGAGIAAVTKEGEVAAKTGAAEAPKTALDALKIAKGRPMPFETFKNASREQVKALAAA